MTDRYERKFVIEGRDVESVRSAVLLHPALFRGIYEPRRINNIYLDTPEYRSYCQHCDGIAMRDKWRVRWYGDVENATPHLECKSRAGEITRKQDFPPGPQTPVPREAAGPGIHGLVEAAACAASDQARVAVASRMPAIRNSYWRHYFLSADGRFRLTIDTDLRASRLDWAIRLNSAPCRFDQLTVLEIKYLPEHDPVAPDLAGFLPRMSKFSKYVDSLDALAV